MIIFNNGHSQKDLWILGQVLGSHGPNFAGFTLLNCLSGWGHYYSLKGSEGYKWIQEENVITSDKKWEIGWSTAKVLPRLNQASMEKLTGAPGSDHGIVTMETGFIELDCAVASKVAQSLGA